MKFPKQVAATAIGVILAYIGITILTIIGAAL